MKLLSKISIVVLLLGVFTATASAQEEDSCRGGVDRSVGECSPGTAAPSVDALMSLIRSGSDQRLMGTLEYGERVECYACVPLLMERALSDDNPRLREFSTWWLRRRTFAANMVFSFFKTTLQTDTDPVRRARAAEALGEFLDPASLAPLRDALMGDADNGVRASAASALGRLNHPGGNVVLAAAMTDTDSTVRLNALRATHTVNFFREYAAVVSLLADTEADIRREAALVVGQHRAADAVPALAAVLRGDESVAARRSAAWALGRIGTAEARTALGDASATESNQNVLDIIEIARRN